MFPSPSRLVCLKLSQQQSKELSQQQSKEYADVHQLLLINTMKLHVSVIFEARVVYKFNATNICIMVGKLCITNTESKGAYSENWGNIN